MLTKLNIILLFIILYLLYINTKKVEYFGKEQIGAEHFNGKIESLKSNIDRQIYKVQQDLPNKQGAADLLSTMNISIIKFIHILNAKFPNNEGVMLLKKRYNPKVVSEGTPLNNDDETSFSVDKGKELVICLRDRRDPSKFHDKNTIMFVVIHELGHLMSKSYGHNAEFNKNFKWLLKQAIDMNFYKYIDYYIQPQMYCGMEINSTPV